jgi:hypothetical protein
MAVTKIRKTSNIVFLVTVFISLVVMGIFVFGGQTPDAERIMLASVYGLSQPRFLDLLIYWTYALVAITVVVLLIFAISGFIVGLKENPKKAIGGFIALVLLGVLLGVAYVLGSGEILDIPGYTGNHNVPGWLRIADMWIYGIYAMVVINILAIIFMPLIGKRK